MSTPNDQPLPVNNQDHQTPFGLQFNIAGIATDPEKLRSELLKVIGQHVLAMEGVDLTALTSDHVTSAEQVGGDATDSETTNIPAIPESLPLFSEKVQAAFDTEIADAAEKFKLTDRQPVVEDENQQQQEARQKRAAEKKDRQDIFFENAKAAGVFTVRDAIIFGKRRLRAIMEEDRPNARSGIRIFRAPGETAINAQKDYDQDVETFVNHIIGVLPKEVYSNLTQAHGKEPLEDPLTTKEIAKFCNSLEQIPAEAIVTAEWRGPENVFPETWKDRSVESLLKEAAKNKDELFEEVLEEINEDRAEALLVYAQEFKNEFEAAKAAA